MNRSKMKKALISITAVLLLCLPIQSIAQGTKSPGEIPVRQPASKAAQVIVGPNVRVSRPNANIPHYELIAAADPADARRLIVCSMAYPETGGTFTVVYVSHDGGTTWGETVRKSDTVAADPACAFGPGGAAYFTTLGGGHAFAYRSSDGGLTWSTPLQLVPHLDREYVVVDNNPASPFFGRVYVHGTGTGYGLDGNLISSLDVVASADSGKTFGPAMQRLALGQQTIRGMGNSAVLSNGDVATVFGVLKAWPPSAAIPSALGRESSNAVVKVAITSGGGRPLTFPERTTRSVSDWYMNLGIVSSYVPTIAVDNGGSAFRDRLYVVWADEKSGQLEIMLSYSGDGGRTWSRPRRVSDGPVYVASNKPIDAVLPVVAVNRSGVVAVAWADRRDHPDGLGWYYRMRVSLDGGDSFTPSLRLSEAAASFGGGEEWPLDSWSAAAPRAGQDSGFTISTTIAFGRFFAGLGDTGGITADANGTFHPVWIDNRTGVPQIWTAPVTVPGAAARNGSPDLAAMLDVSDKVDLEIGRRRYDRARGTLSIDVRVTNRGRDTLVAPMKLRILGVESLFDSVEVREGNAWLTAEGAVVDLTRGLTNGQLAAGQMSASLEINFRLAGLRLPPGARAFGGEVSEQFLRFESAILCTGSLQRP